MTFFPVNLYTLSSFVAGTFCLIVSGVAHFHGESTRAKFHFSLVSLAVGIWTFFPLVTTLATEDVLRLWLGRATYVAAAFTPPSFMFLVGELVPSSGKPYRLGKWVSFWFGVMFFAALPTPWFIEGIQATGHFRAVKAGLLFHFYVLFFSISFSYAFLALFNGIKVSTGLKRNQLNYVFFSFFIGCIGGSLHFLAVYTHSEPIPHDLFIILFVAMLSYAIVKHRLMDVNLAARNMLVQISFGLMIGGPAAGFVVWANLPWVDSVVILGLAMFGPILFNYLQEDLTMAIDRLPLFRGRYERFSRLQIHLQGITLAKSFPEWEKGIVDVVVSLYRSHRVILLSRDEPGKRFLIKSSHGLDQATAVFASLPKDGHLARFLAKEGTILIAETASLSFKPEEWKQVDEDLKFLGASVVVPIFNNEELYSVLLLGEKERGGVYNDLELTSLSALARGAEHTLRVILSGLAKEQTTAVWAHDLVKPFSPKGSFLLLQGMLGGAFGPVSDAMRSAVQLMMGDVAFVRKNLTRVLNPGQPDNFDIVPGALTPVFDRLRGKFSALADIQGLTWRVNTPPPYIRVFWDGAMIEHRVLGNLIENAFRHTPRGGKIELGYRLLENKLLVYVKDTGVGIRKEEIEKLFQPRAQLEDGTGGLAGLGLFSAKTVVQAHKGSIWVESTYGEGASFNFDLPLASATPSNRGR